MWCVYLQREELIIKMDTKRLGHIWEGKKRVELIATNQTQVLTASLLRRGDDMLIKKGKP